MSARTIVEASTGQTEREILRQLAGAERPLVERHVRDGGDLAYLALDIVASGERSTATWWDERASVGDVALLARLATASVVPCLLIPVADEPDPDVLREAVTLAEAVPALPVAIVMAWAAWRDACECLGASRYLALLQEGEIPISVAADGFGAQRRPDDVPDADCSVPPSSSTPMTTSMTAADLERAREARVTPPSLASLRVASNTLVEATATGGETKIARSQIEAAFFELLEENPRTVGRFELNGKLEVFHGPKPAEVDLLARDLGIAIEIDGYHHFGHVDAYRRDRRKDVLLQKEGYVVLRFLADDVYPKLTEILRTIDDVVRWRLGAGGTQE